MWFVKTMFINFAELISAWRLFDIALSFHANEIGACCLRKRTLVPWICLRKYSMHGYQVFPTFQIFFISFIWVGMGYLGSFYYTIIILTCSSWISVPKVVSPGVFFWGLCLGLQLYLPIFTLRQKILRRITPSIKQSFEWGPTTACYRIGGAFWLWDASSDVLSYWVMDPRRVRVGRARRSSPH